MKNGEVYKIYYNEGNRNNKVLQIRAVVDDEWIVSRSREVGTSDSWIYRMEHKSFFDLLIENGSMKKLETT